MAEKRIEEVNGATLASYRHTLNEMTYGTVGVISGARLDPKGKEGLHHLEEHMLFKKDFIVPEEDDNGEICFVKKYDKEFLKYLKQNGIKMGAYTSNDAVVVNFEAPSDKLDLALDIIGQMFSVAEFDQKRLNKEKKVVIQERLMILDEEGVDSLKSNRSAAKSKTKLIGSPASINSITVEDLQNNLKKRFIRNNLVISLVSSLPYKEVKKLATEKIINKLPSDNRRKLTLNTPTYEHKNDYKTKDIPFANTFDIQFLFKGLDGVEKNDLMLRFEDWYFNDIAGKLFEKFRIDNQLVYTSQFVSVPVLNSNLKAFIIKTSPENANRCVEVLSEILRDLIKNGINEEDFALFKETMLKERASKSNVKFMDSDKMFNDCIYGKQVFVKDFFNKLMNLKREDVNNYLKKVYGKSNLSVFYEGDMIKAQNIKLLQGKNGLIVIDKNYPYFTVTQEQLAKDYLNINPLYNHDEILAMYKYWDEVQLEILKIKIQAEYDEKVAKILAEPKEYKPAKIGKKVVMKAYIKTLEERNAKDKKLQAEKEEAEREWEFK